MARPRRRDSEKLGTRAYAARVLEAAGLVPNSGAPAQRFQLVPVFRSTSSPQSAHTCLVDNLANSIGERFVRMALAQDLPASLIDSHVRSGTRNGVAVRASRKETVALARVAATDDVRVRPAVDSMLAAIRAYERPRPSRIRGVHRVLSLGQSTRVMGVLNVTPDSFSDGGRFFEPERAVEQAHRMIDEGAAIIDVGGESTRPGATDLPPGDEWKRVEPVVKRLHETASIPISIDTRHPQVAARALAAGADFVNDITGLRDPKMRKLVVRSRAAAIIMHMRGTPANMAKQTGYTDPNREVYSELFQSVTLARKAGVPEDQILIDPGLGFAKTAEQSLALLTRVGEFRSMGYPVVVGASRKSFLGAVLGNAPVTGRLEASLAAAVVASLEGVALVRAHDVGPTVRALQFADAARLDRPS